MGASQQPLGRRNGSFPTTAQEKEWDLPKYCPREGVGASQQLLRRRSGSFPTTAQEEEWELPNCIPGGGVGASQQLLRRRGGSFLIIAQEEGLLLLLLRPGDAVWGSNALPACCARSKISWIAPRTFPQKREKVCPNIWRGLCFRWPWTFWPGCQIVSIQNRSIEFAIPTTTTSRGCGMGVDSESSAVTGARSRNVIKQTNYLSFSMPHPRDVVVVGIANSMLRF